MHQEEGISEQEIGEQVIVTLRFQYATMPSVGEVEDLAKEIATVTKRPPFDRITNVKYAGFKSLRSIVEEVTLKFKTKAMRKDKRQQSVSSPSSPFSPAMFNVQRCVSPPDQPIPSSDLQALLYNHIPYTLSWRVAQTSVVLAGLMAMFYTLGSRRYGLAL